MHVVIIGGGFAGLKAAVDLADQGIRVTLLESRNSLGGRARSFIDPATGEVVDNGQHLFLASYKETLAFLRRLGTDRHLVFQQRLKVSFVQPGGKVSHLDCPAAPPPWHFVFGLARLTSLSWKDKLAFRNVLKVVSHTDLDDLDAVTVEEWLKAMGQSEQSRTHFWYPLAIATLNESPSRASALGLVQVLRVFLRAPWHESRLGIAGVGLSDLYAEAARKAIEDKGGEVRLNSPVAELLMEDSRVCGVRLANGTSLEADRVVSALPPPSLARILSTSVVTKDPFFLSLNRFTSSPILSVNLWLDRPVTEALFVGMIGTRFQWLFNKPAILGRAGIKVQYLSLILSAAHDFIDRSNEELATIALEDLRALFPQAKEARGTRYQVVREREATVSLTVGLNRCRPGPCAPFSNLVLAGDWTATGLPATIESAVLSGKRAAQAVLQELAPLARV